MLCLHPAGEAAVPEGDPPGTSGPGLALPVWGEGEEGAEPGQVPGQPAPRATPAVSFVLSTYTFI